MKRKLRIAYFAEIFPSKSETWVHSEIIELKKLGYEVRVFSTWKAPEKFALELDEFYDITIYRESLTFLQILSRIPSLISTFLNRKVLYAFLFDNKGLMQRAQVLRDCFFLYSYIDKINEYKPDLTYAHFAASRANLAFLYKAIKNVPYIIKIHAADVFSRTAMFSSKVNESLRVYSISKYNIDFILKRENNLNSSKLIVNHCGINLKSYEFISKNISSNSVNIVSVGRLVKMKGFDVLIDACKELLKFNLDFNVTIIGDGHLKQNLQQQINTNKLGDRVVLKDYCTPTEVKQYLRNASLFILPCRFDNEINTQDGIPVALLESMAIGTPVLSTYISGIPELINDRKNGFLIEPDNALELAQKIISIIKMELSELNNILLEARKTVEKDFNISTLTSALVDDVNTLL